MFNLRPLYFILPFLLTTYLPPDISPGSPLELDSTHMIFHYHGSDTTSMIGWFIRNLGDINSDGYDDVALTSKSPVGTYIFLGGNPPYSFPDYFLAGDGVIGKFLDYNGDGLADLITSSMERVYLYRGFGDSISATPIDSITMPSGLNYYLLYASGDVNNNSIGDVLMVSDEPLSDMKAYLLLDPFCTDHIPDWIYAITNYSHRFSRSGFIDFNGDSDQDIFLSMSEDQDTLGYVYLFLGPVFAPQPDIIIAPPSDLDSLQRKYFADHSYNVGDINGDGWEDLGVLAWSSPVIYLCGPGADTIYDFALDGHCTYMAGAGDINADSYNDLVVGGSDTYDGRVIVYIGGPSFDSIRDDQIDCLGLPPLFVDMIGWRVSSAGDFNGDGYDDIMFSCQNFAHGEPRDVFVFSGGEDIVADVHDIYHRILPEKCILKQNHPNPFNQSTAIEFELARKSVITLEIYSCLGQRISTLIDEKTYSAGLHRITWDGQLSDGSPAPSGVYFCRLRADGFRDTRRMVLIR